MKQLSLLLTCIALVVATTACTETTTPTNTSTPAAAASPDAPASTMDEFASARANFTKHCVPCHGENAEGGLVEVAGKEIKVPSLKAHHAIRHSDEEIKSRITNGEEAMPAFKDKLSEAEIAELVRFVRKEFQGQ